MSKSLMLAVLLGLTGMGRAADTLVVFKTGDTARAAAVNANFRLLWQRFDSLSSENRGLAAENRTLAKRLDSLQKAIPAGGDSLDSGLPIGTIVASLLPPTEFEAFFGTKTWMLADGSPAPAAYIAAFKTERLPDLRGVFLRGLNQGRNDAFSDPSGTARMPGSLQGDATRRPDSAFVIGSAGAHTHVLELETTATRNFNAADAPVATNTVASPARTGSPNPPLSTSGAHSHSLSGGDRETRPKNAAVYYYIKVR